MTKNYTEAQDIQPAHLLNDEADMTINHAALLANMEQVFTESRPHLLRLAYLNGMSTDIADDVVQETMMEAWRRIGHLRDPQRFDAWLDGICRNICRRHQAQDSTLHLHESLSSLTHNNETMNEADALLTIPDPLAIDPVEELSRQDMATLLDRALGHLSPDTRNLLEMCYLLEKPQREVAMQLGLTIGALELRLHRARKQLRQVLSSELRTDAESLGLVFDPLEMQGWRETRQWCWFCGKHRMIGIFEKHSDGHVDLRLRCPDCSNRYNLDICHSTGLVSVEGYSSFRPAIKRVLQQAGELLFTRSTCFRCNKPASIRIIHSSCATHPLPPDRYWVCTECPNCGVNETDISTSFVSHPVVHRFFVQHEHFINEPYQLLEHDGSMVICARLTDVMSADQLTVLLDTQMLRILAVF
jgi:RNA polymerase sigma-70 factor (ECF subfamily)